MKSTTLLSLLGLLTLTGSTFAQAFVIPEGMSETDRKRFERFETFRIKGVCGDRDMDRLAEFGVNTVHGYTIEEPAVTRQKLDRADRLGLKMIVSEWMPHQGENEKRKGGSGISTTTPKATRWWRA
jgi:hypothetical protein